MNKILYLFIILIITSSCSLNKNSKFWTSSETIRSENEIEYEEVFPFEEALKKEFNSKLEIRLTSKSFNKTSINNYFNNNDRINFNGNLERSCD